MLNLCILRGLDELSTGSVCLIVPVYQTKCLVTSWNTLKYHLCVKDLHYLYNFFKLHFSLRILYASSFNSHF